MNFRNEVILFIGFYAISAVVYYTATWISYSAFEPTPLPYFQVEEFFAAAGAQFIISFMVTLPIWYVTTIVLKNYSLKLQLATHIVFLPLFVSVCYFMQLWTTQFFGWAMFWGGYKTVWTLYMLMLFYLVQFGFIHAYAYFKRFKKEESEKAALREVALKSELTALKAQLNPHFLHNLFNSINASIPPENESTRELIIQLSDLFRYQNYASQQEYVSIEEEVAFIENYLQLMKIRLKERLVYVVEVERAAKSHKIAPMLLQPLVENAITHGIAPKVESSDLHIKVVKRDTKIHISIEDTGLGIADKATAFDKGLGLANTQMRLHKIYNTQLHIEDKLPTGTKISFVI